MSDRSDPRSAQFGGVFVCLATVAGLCFGLPGCSRKGVPEPRVIRTAYDPLNEVRSRLEGYASGQSVGSEREAFPRLVEEIRAADPDKAEWLGKGLAEINAKPAQARSIAKKLLAKLDE